MKILLLACVKLRSPLKKSQFQGLPTVLLETREELRGRPKTFNDADTHFITELVPNSRTWPILSIHVYKIHTRQLRGRINRSAAFKEADPRETLKTQDVLFGELQSQKLLRFPTSALKNQTKAGVGASRNNNIKCDALECRSFEKTIHKMRRNCRRCSGRNGSVETHFTQYGRLVSPTSSKETCAWERTKPQARHAPPCQRHESIPLAAISDPPNRS